MRAETIQQRGQLAGRDAVINLVGILQGSRGMPYGPEFARAHVELPRRIVVRCPAHGIRRCLHMSALGADSKGPSMYQRSKGDGEAAVRDSGLDWTIFQPSVIFGPEDRFLNTFAMLASIAPVLPIANAEARFQPIWVGEVADAFVNALDESRTIHRTYELAGPKIYALRELVQFAANASGHRRPVIGLPGALARAQAMLMELAPGEPLLSRARRARHVVDGDVTAGAQGLAGPQPGHARRHVAHAGGGGDDLDVVARA